jgi:hypothetical protein
MDADDRAVSGEFDKVRRRQVMSRLAARLRREPDDVNEVLPFEEVVDALGRRAQRDLGVQAIPLDAIVGTVDRRAGEFDRSFRPADRKLRGRWQRVAAAKRRGAPMPPIEVYRVGDLYFVEDGHHRVSVARAMGEETIEAHVREVSTQLGADRDLRPSELPLKRHERVFFERVPLPAPLRGRIRLTDEWRYAQLAALVEARGFRESHALGHLVAREENALRWFREQYEPVVAALREARVGGPGTDTDRYLRFMILRFLLLYTHDWSDEVIERLIGEIRKPAADDDTLVHQILGEMTSGPSPGPDEP